ncbi:ABC transporter permease [Levilactobacillus tangyuanensis]|uniref:ABC transporter permease n=1 Tax=Levilactobacillus tangyuanensis TaxID=2486021 RepID=A0ABW1TR73_9LACO|nr:ABC transporter permease [Levilactobacillus tangyuanensis]
MTNLWSAIKAMSGSRFRQMNQILLIDLIAIAVTTLWTAVTGHFADVTILSSVSGWAFVTTAVSFVMLAVASERAFTSDSLRLIPLSDGKFYFANLVASFGQLLYVWVAQAILGAIGLLFAWGTITRELRGIWSWNAGLQTPGDLFQTGATLLILAFMIWLVIWSTISLAHLVTNVITRFLPRFRQQVVSFVLYVAIIWVTIRLVSFVGGLVQKFSSLLIGQQDLGQLWIAILSLAIISALEIAANLFMLKKWVETVH